MFSDLLFLTNLFYDYDTTPTKSKWQPVTKIKEQEASFMVTLEVPGFDPKELKVEVDDTTLTVSGTREDVTFEKNYTLPKTVNVSALTSTYKYGILEVVVPKRVPSC